MLIFLFSACLLNTSCSAIRYTRVNTLTFAWQKLALCIKYFFRQRRTEQHVQPCFTLKAKNFWREHVWELIWWSSHPVLCYKKHLSRNNYSSFWKGKEQVPRFWYLRNKIEKKYKRFLYFALFWQFLKNLKKPVSVKHSKDMLGITGC